MYPMKPYVDFKNPIELPTSMYCMKPYVDFKNPIELPTNMYSMEPTIIDITMSTNTNVSIDDSFNKNTKCLLERQNKILAQLQTLKSTVETKAKSENINLIDVYAVQDEILNRLRRIEVTVTTELKMKNIIYVPSVSELTQSQNLVLERTQLLQHRVQKLADSNSISLPTSSGTSSTCYNTIMVNADPTRPPVSLIAFLRVLRQQGLSVACKSYQYNTSSANPHPAIVELIDKYLYKQRNCAVSIVLSWISTLSLQDATSIFNVFDDTPLYGELSALLLTARLLNIDFTSSFSTLQKLNQLFHIQHDFKTGLNVVAKLAKNLESQEDDGNDIIASFMLSCLFLARDVCGNNDKFKSALTAVETKLGFALTI